MLVNMLPSPRSSVCRILLLDLTILAASASWLPFATGCTTGLRRAAVSTGPVQPMIVGEIALVDEAQRFVLVDLDNHLYVPSPGTALQTTNASGEVAHLKASPEQKRPFIAADIIDGDPVVGDQVIK